MTGTVGPAAADELLDPERIQWVRNLPFLAVQLACLLVFWTGVSPVAVLVGLVTLFTRMFGLTAGYHRYFCHRAFRTSRAFQFVLAWLGAAAAQRGPLWWGGHHRRHHRHSDTEQDVHPPGVKGMLWAHAGWIMSAGNDRTRVEWIRDFARFPELRWLDAHHYVAPVSLGVALFGLGHWLSAAYPELGTSGAQLVVVAFLCSTTLLYHVTFAVNSIGHRFGSRRYDTNDASRNRLLAGSGHRRRGLAQQPPPLSGLRAPGLLLVGGRPDPLRRRAAVVAGAGLGRSRTVGRRDPRRRALIAAYHSGSANTNRLLPALGRISGVSRPNREAVLAVPVPTATYCLPSTA